MDEMMLQSCASLQLRQMASELRTLNVATARYGLTLTEPEITELCEGRVTALRESARVEFGSGILPQLALTFCESPFLTAENYAETLASLQDCFYYYKSESDDRLSDEELLHLMKQAFDGEAQGSLDFLSETSLSELCRAARRGEEYSLGSAIPESREDADE